MVDPNVLVHEERTELLRRMPPGATTILSAGCAGRWYFDWVEQAYGPVAKHLGIEFFSPKPADLPSYVEWIANTAANMEAVKDGSCDLVLSGQNIEHMWPGDQVGFFLEAARVIKRGGTLVVDAPNRSITKPLVWSHPEHMVEFTVHEAVTLFQLAGFDVTKVAGIWLCRDPETQRVLPFDPNTEESLSIEDRRVMARNNPQGSFIWWIEGQRSDRAPDEQALRNQVNAIFSVGWPERTQRTVLWGDRTADGPGPDAWVSCPAETHGPVFFGPYMPVPAGRHRVTFNFGPAAKPKAVFAHCDVVYGDGTAIAAGAVPAGASQFSLEFDLAELTFGLQFRCISAAGPAFKVRRAPVLVNLTPVPEYLA